MIVIPPINTTLSNDFFSNSMDYILNLNNKQKITLFIMIFVAFYLYSFNQGDNANNFFIISTIFVGFMISKMSSKENVKVKNDIKGYIRDIETTVMNHTTQEMVLESVYKVHKPLRSIRFIKSSEEAMQIVYYLRFLNIYDREMYLDTIIYLEYFLKIHFNVMIGKYDVKTNVSILHDIRHEILNSLQSNHFNIPKVSMTFDSVDLDKRMRTAIHKMQAFTHRYIKIIHKKYKRNIASLEYEGPKAQDSFKNESYHIY
jgi:hypothetical protein